MAAAGTMAAHGFTDEVNNVLSTLKRGGAPPTKFAESLLELLEVTAKIQQLDDLNASAQAVGEDETEETRRWKDISVMSANLCRGGLVEQQLGAIEKLQGLAARGGSLCAEASSEDVCAPIEPRKGAHAGTGGDSAADSGGSDGEAGTGGVAAGTRLALAGPPPPGLSLPGPAATCAPAAGPPAAPNAISPPPGFGGPPGLSLPKPTQGGPKKKAPAQAKSSKAGEREASSWAEKAKGAVAFEPKAASCTGLNLDAYDD